MTRAACAVCWSLALTLCVVALAVVGRHAALAHSARDRAIDQLRSTKQRVDRIAALDAQLDALVPRPHPRAADGDAHTLAALLADTLAATSLPESTLAALHAAEPVSSNAAANAPGTQRSQATVTLRSVTLPRLGQFLAHWSAGRPDWTVATVTLTPEPRTPDQPGADQPAQRDAPLAVVLGLERFVLADPDATTGTHAAKEGR